MNLTRRRFLGWGTGLFAGASVGFTTLFTRKAKGVGFGPLVSDPNLILDLPEGFRYQILQTSGDLMSDGNTARILPDGMAAFPGSGSNEVILMRNHEIGSGGGGVSRLVVDTSDLDNLVVVSSNDVLTGTSRNCSGGPSPWGWLSCEENPGGGVWLCPTATSSVLNGVNRVRIDDYGSFRHEAVCVDPDTLTAYLTEDDGNSFLYRMVPTDPVNDPFVGQLQAMKRVGASGFDTATMSPGDAIDIEWVNVNPATARSDASAAGASIVVRGEGIWWFDGVVYFSATSNGQVFSLTPDEDGSGGVLVLLADTLDWPDNLCVAPWGDIFVAEDNGSANHIDIVEPDGTVLDFAANVIDPGGEFAGVCFSPDGKILFVNIMYSGLTFAITGPFPEGSTSGATSTDGTTSNTNTSGTTSTGGTNTSGTTSTDGASSASSTGGATSSTVDGGGGSTTGGATSSAGGVGGSDTSGSVGGSGGAGGSGGSDGGGAGGDGTGGMSGTSQSSGTGGSIDGGASASAGAAGEPGEASSDASSAGGSGGGRAEGNASSGGRSGSVGGSAGAGGSGDDGAASSTSGRGADSSSGDDGGCSCSTAGWQNDPLGGGVLATLLGVVAVVRKLTDADED